MSQVKLGLATLSVPNKIQFARQVVIDMTGNANFTTPAPTLASITTAATALETAYNAAQAARQVAKGLTVTQEAKDAALDLLLTQEANYVENTSGGDAAKIDSSGFAVRNTPAPVGELPAPANLDAEPSDTDGMIDLTWDRVPKAKSYSIQKAPDSTGTLAWVSAGVATKAKTSVNSMASGARFWFRVAAVNAAGQGAWSNPVPKIVP